jgi:hypothetical protein
MQQREKEEERSEEEYNVGREGHNEVSEMESTRDVSEEDAEDTEGEAERELAGGEVLGGEEDEGKEWSEKGEEGEREVNCEVLSEEGNVFTKELAEDDYSKEGDDNEEDAQG